MTAKKHDPARQIDLQRMYLATFLVTAFAACVGALFFKVIPPENKDLLTYMIGQLSGMATMALGFYFVNKAGQDAADAAKSENTGKMADAVVAAASGAARQPSPFPADVADGAQAAADAAQETADELKEGAVP